MSRVAILLLLALSGCGLMFPETYQRVTLYDANGQVIQVWEGEMWVSPGAGGDYFIRMNGKRFSLTGTVVVDREPRQESGQ